MQRSREVSAAHITAQGKSEKFELIPGALYCTFVRADFDGEADRDGPFVYWTGGQFVTEDGDDADHIDWDYLVRQVGDVNAAMIEPMS